MQVNTFVDYRLSANPSIGGSQCQAGSLTHSPSEGLDCQCRGVVLVLARTNEPCRSLHLAICPRGARGASVDHFTVQTTKANIYAHDYARSQPRHFHTSWFKGKHTKTITYPAWKRPKRLENVYRDRHDMSSHLCRLLAVLSNCRSVETQSRKQANSFVGLVAFTSLLCSSSKDRSRLQLRHFNYTSCY